MPLSAIILCFVEFGLELLAAGVILRRGLTKWLTPALLRLVWGAVAILIGLLAVEVPGRWEALFYPALAHYYLGASILIAWMAWNARAHRHALSGLTFRWLTACTLLNAVAGPMYTFLPSALVQAICSGSVILASLRIAWVVVDQRESEQARLIWRRDGTCRLEPQPQSPDFLVRNPELLLEIVARAASPDCRSALLGLLRVRYGQQAPVQALQPEVERC